MVCYLDPTQVRCAAPISLQRTLLDLPHLIIPSLSNQKPSPASRHVGPRSNLEDEESEDDESEEENPEELADG